MREKHYEDGYEPDLAVDRLQLDDLVYNPLLSEGISVDGDGGSIRNKPVFTVDEAAFYLNRGDPKAGATYDPNNPTAFFEPNTGAQWAGAQGGHNGIYDAFSKSYVEGQPLTELTFGFYGSRADIDPAYNFIGGNAPGRRRLDGFSAFTDAQKAATRVAIDAWDELIPVQFREVAPANADMNFMNTTTGPAQASAYLPYNYGPTFAGVAGDVAVNPNQASNQVFAPGQYGLTTLVHEIGHSLGLEHPGRYNFGPGFAVTYDNGADYYQDSNQYSIMSYWDSEETGGNHVDWALLTYRYPATPQVHDIAAVQRIYGVDTTTRTGDTTYGFNSNAGKAAFDLTKNPTPVFTIWDAGGVDTLDLSGYNTPSIIDLNPGEFSSAGGLNETEIPTLAEINSRRAAAGLGPRSQATYDLYLDLFGEFYENGAMTNNIAIAYGVTIENAKGGAGDDLFRPNDVANVLTGNGGTDTVSYEDATTGVTASLARQYLNSGLAAAGDKFVGIENLTGSDFNDILQGLDATNNVLDGGAGNDSIFGALGNDTLIGGEGIDTADYSFVTTGVNVSIGLKGAQDTGSAGLDTLSGFENLSGSRGNDRLTGTREDNLIKGGGGNDYVNAGEGNDVVQGDDGDDVLDAGLGDDALDGGIGTDRAEYGTIFTSVRIDLNQTGRQNTGGGGNDILRRFENIGGSRADDVLIGDGNANVISGNNGNDVINGNGGVDTLLGDSGDDTLNGGAGADVLGGGAGADRFVFTSFDGDRVVDYDVGEVIDLSSFGRIAFRSVVSGGRNTLTFDSDGDDFFDDGSIILTGAGHANPVLFFGDMMN